MEQIIDNIKKPFQYDYKIIDNIKKPFQNDYVIIISIIVLIVLIIYLAFVIKEEVEGFDSPQQPMSQPTSETSNFCVANVSVTGLNIDNIKSNLITTNGNITTTILILHFLLNYNKLSPGILNGIIKNKIDILKAHITNHKTYIKQLSSYYLTNNASNNMSITRCFNQNNENRYNIILRNIEEFTTGMTTLNLYYVPNPTSETHVTTEEIKNCNFICNDIYRKLNSNLTNISGNLNVINKKFVIFMI
jgi:hypothetical protein